MKKTLVIIFLISLGLYSCKKDSNSVSDKDFIEITLNGETYKTEWPKDFHYSYDDQEGCGGVPYTIAIFSDIVTSNFEFWTDFKYYQNNENFKNSVPGSYQITDGVDVPSSCNLCLQVVFVDDKTVIGASTYIQPGCIHNVTSIQEINSTTTQVTYVVRGNFSCSFLNLTNELYSVTGKYQVTINAYQ